MRASAPGAAPGSADAPRSNGTAPVAERLPRNLILLYGAPSFAGAAMAIPIIVHMPKFYADVVLVPLGYLGIGIALARAFDAITDPLMGWLSDRTRSRWGRRRPYLVVGALLCAFAFVALFTPPVGMDASTAIVWFTTTFVLYFLFHTVYIIPHYALGPELTLDYHERSRLFAWRELFVVLGTIVASLAPGFLAHALGDIRIAYSACAVVFATLLVVLYVSLTVRVRERPDFVNRPPNAIVPGVRRALRNRPFRILLATYVVGSIPGAIPGTLMPFFNAYVIRPDNPELWLSVFLGTYFGSAAAFLPVWLWAARRFGKRPAWLASMLFGVTGGSAMFFLGPGDTQPLLALLVWTGSAVGAGLFLGPAIQADVIDYDELYTGKRREAQYAAFWSILPKFVVIPSAAIPIAFLGTIGYVPNQPMQPPEVVLAIRAIFALAPAFFGTIAFFIAWRLPITEAVHRAILAGIEAHGRGSTATDPLTEEGLPPPRDRGVDEETGWFLDHFSRRELRRVVKHGPRSVISSVRLSLMLSVTLVLAASTVVVVRVQDASRDPGVVAVVALVVAGLSLAAMLFHLVRLPRAHRLARGEIPRAALLAHLGEVRA